MIDQPTPDAEARARLIAAAREATGKLRDAARLGTIIEFRQRDELVVAIHRALDLLAAEGWRDISTAPKDGSRFLFTNGEIVGCGFYINGHAFAADSWRDTKNTVPTHWMPLPSPPGGGR